MGSLWSSPLAILATVAVLYAIALAVYRITPGLHPLARFPGPKLAAATGWYELFADLFGGPRATFAFRIRRLHAAYGPIVRITPDELHVSDPAFLDTLYGGRLRRDKYARGGGAPLFTPRGVFGTVAHEAHRRRRAAISAHFARRAVLRSEAVIRDKAELLCRVFLCHEDEKEQLPVVPVALDVRAPLMAYATDFYCAHALGDDGQMDLLRDPQRAATARSSIVALMHWVPVVRHLPWIPMYAIELPLWLVRMVSSELALVVGIYKNMRRQARRAIATDPSIKPACTGDESGDDGAPRTLFQTMLASNLPTAEKDFRRLEQEAFNIFVASGETIAHTMTTALYHLLANPPHLERLRKELDSVMPHSTSPANLVELEQLPWFTAVLKESLRISALFTSRSVLEAPDEWLRFNEWAIPPKTPVGMTFGDLMMDDNIFPSPQNFDPERWLQSNPDYIKNNSNFAPFSRGHRNCIGINLAWAEMYIGIAMLVRRYDLQLYDVVRDRDIDNSWDCFLGEPSTDSPGVRVKVVGMRS